MDADNIPIQQKQQAASEVKNLNTDDRSSTHQGAAKKKLLAELRNQNRKETTYDITFPGSIIWTAGRTTLVDNTFGFFAGKYLIDKATHRIGRGGQGYEVNVCAHKCLVGY